MGGVNVNPEANTVIFHAYDGYTTSLPLDYIIDNNIMLAYKMNDVTLLPERGFRESRGYANDGGLDRPFFD